MKTLLISLGIIILVLVIIFWYKRYKSRIVKWIFVIEILPDSTAEVRLCWLLATYKDGTVKVRVARDNRITTVILIDSNYYFQDQYKEAIEFINTTRAERLEALKSSKESINN